MVVGIAEGGFVGCVMRLYTYGGRLVLYGGVEWGQANGWVMEPWGRDWGTVVLENFLPGCKTPALAPVTVESLLMSVNQSLQARLGG